MSMTPAPVQDIIEAKPLLMLGDSITTDHISPAGNDQGRQPRRPVAAGAPGREGRLQQLRRAPRQPRSDDARHLRQHPHQERNGAGRRRRLLAQWRSAADL
jgi:aconitate hydratase